MPADRFFFWLAALFIILTLDVAALRWVRGLRRRNLTLWAWLAHVTRRPLERLRQFAARLQPPPMIDPPPPPPASPAPEPEPASVVVESIAIVASPASAPGLIHVQFSADVPEGVTLRVTIETIVGQEAVVKSQTIGGSATPAPRPLTVPVAQPLTAPARPRFTWPTLNAQTWVRWRAAWQVRNLSAGAVWFGVALTIYLLTRLIGITRYPVYFFTDEAIHTNMAADFIRDGLRNYDHEFLPAYFNVGLWVNSISVYLQVIPYLIFGKSEFITRAVSAIVTAFGAAAVGLTLKDIFDVRHWWMGVLLLGIAPAWFLHSRTAFEYIEVASFYAIFIYCYLRYRTGAPRYLYAAVVAGALVFYTHSLGQILIGVTALALLVSDARYHWQQRLIVGRAFVLAVVLALPYFRFIQTHEDTYFEGLRGRASYWTEISIPLADKLRQYVSEYLYGFSPEFWFFPNTRDLNRHMMKGYGNLLWPTLPFALLGVGLALRRFRSAPHRALILTLLATPVGSALVAIGVPRMLWFIVPATLLTALGLSATLDWLERYLARLRPLTGPILFAMLAGFNIFMLADALINGPLWYTDYGLYGMQYGGRQLFGQLIPARLAQDPTAQVVVSPSWANGTDQLLTFFIKPAQLPRVQLGTVDEYLFNPLPLTDNMLFVMIPGEYERAAGSPKFKRASVEEVVPYPDGTPGFYLVRLQYADDVAAQFAAEIAERRKPITETVELDGETVTITHSLFGAGAPVHLFDADPFTLVRGLEANPLLIDLQFPTPHASSALTLTTGSMTDFTVTATLYAPGSDPVTYVQQFVGTGPDPTVVMDFDRGPAQAERFTLEVNNNTSGETSQIHIREIVIK